MDLTDPIREVILEKKPTSEVRKLARKEGMSFLRESALDRVRRGTDDAEGDQQGYVY
jgi:type IV pilus assembly protein PilB